MTALPPILRAWQAVGRVSPWTMHARAAAALFRTNSLPRRLMSAVDSIDNSARVALHHATSAHIERWERITSQFVIDALPKFGTLLVSEQLPGSSDRLVAWCLGGHIVVQLRDGRQEIVRANAPAEDLIRGVVARTTAELDTNRLYLDHDGLVADAAHYGEHVAEQTEALIEDVRAERAAGESCRVVLLHGPPGTGKSTMARQLAASVAEVVVAVDGVVLAADRQSYGSSAGEQPEHVVSVIRHCGARAVVIDDYDRRRSEGQSLAMLRDLRTSTDLVVITANDLRAFTPAELRAGRVDKLVRVDALDPKTAHRIAPDLPDSVRDLAHRTLHAAFLHELAVLCRAGRVDPEQALAELRQRQGGESP